ncbi:6430_t:CDS:2, partial [Scutellospora calospora]
IITEKHKLIPLVYAILDIQEGPTFIRICSNKHDSSTAYSHNKDFNNLMIEEQLHNYTTTYIDPSEQHYCLSEKLVTWME